MNNQVLIVGAHKTKKITIAKDIFKVNNVSDYLLDPELASHSGVIIDQVLLETKYYKACLGLFIDEFENDGMEAYNDWFAEFRSDEMRELRDVLQGLIITISIDNLTMDNIRSMASQLESISNCFDDEYIELKGLSTNVLQWNGFKVVVGSSNLKSQIEEEKLVEIEDIVLSCGFDFVYYDDKRKRNEYGDSYGVDRLKEMIESCEWESLESKPIMKKDLDTNNNSKPREYVQPLLNAGHPVTELDQIINKLQQAKIKVALDKETNQPQDDIVRYVDNVVADVLRHL